MKAVVAAFNQEEALVGAFSVIVQPVVEPMDRFTALVTIQHSINPDQPLVELLTSDQNEASLVNIESLILHNYIETMPHTAQCFQTNVTYNNVSQFAILSES